MLRSPDDPNSNLRTRVLTDTHRRRPEVTTTDAYRFGIEEEYFLVDAHTKLVTRDMPEDLPGHRQAGDQWTGHGRIPAVADRGGDAAASSTSAPPTPSFGICARPWRRSPPIMASPSSPPARIRPPIGAGRSRCEGGALRRGDGRSADDRPPQHAVRHARACRAARPRRPRRRDDAHAAVPAAVHRAVDLVAVLALAPDRAQGLSPRRL